MDIRTHQTSPAISRFICSPRMVRQQPFCISSLRRSSPRSYQVPKEVGKVGTESPTFIEPVSNRKDGIQAMFMKQTQSQNKLNSPKRSPLKRQRSDSPTKESDMATDLNPVRSSAKKRKSEEKDLVIIEGPFTPTKVGHILPTLYR
jgi:hypothetical protein